MSDEVSDDDNGVTLSAEIMDREERKKLKAKKKAEEDAKKAPPTEEELKAAVAESKRLEAQKKKRKRTFNMIFGGGFAALIAYGVYYLFAPYQAGLTYGVCKTFLELNVRFPQDLRVSTVEDYGNYVRIWYTQLDSFGEYRMENIQCNFKEDPVTGAVLDTVSVNRREVDPAKVESFNISLAILLQNPPDLTIPYPLPDSLQSLQLNTDAFRFQLNLPQINRAN